MLATETLLLLLPSLSTSVPTLTSSDCLFIFGCLQVTLGLHCLPPASERGSVQPPSEVLIWCNGPLIPVCPQWIRSLLVEWSLELTPYIVLTGSLDLRLLVGSRFRLHLCIMQDGSGSIANKRGCYVSFELQWCMIWAQQCSIKKCLTTIWTIPRQTDKGPDISCK